MCPSEPVCPPVDIGAYWSDEEVVMLLERIVRGGPPLANIMTEVNPYNVMPWNLPDEIWYFYGLEDPTVTETGYWKATGEYRRIYTNSSTIGSRFTLQFYLGQDPHGIKTDWVMHDYRINQKGLSETGKATTKDSHSLSRVFLSYSQCSEHGEQYGKNTNKKPVMLDNEQNQKSPISRSQINRTDEFEPLAFSKRRIEDSRPDNPSQSCDFSEGDYLELLDLDNPGDDRETYSSSSVNSRCPSMSSDECLDASALLRDIDSGNGQDIEEKYAANKFIASAPTRLVQVVLKPESLGSERCTLRSGENHVQDSFLPPVATIDGSDHVPCVPNIDVANGNPSTTNRNEVTLLPNRIHETAGASSSAGTHGQTSAESKAIRSRLRKLKKKYWCFTPF